MRCSCCNKKLSDYETTLKHGITGAYMDMCMNCLCEVAAEVPLPVKGRKDLIADMDMQERLDNENNEEYNNYFEDDKEDKDDY